MPDSNIEVLRKETYLKMIQNSQGTRLFNSLMVRLKNTGEVKDLLEDGNVSCAAFVGSILWLNRLIDSHPATVETVRNVLPKCGWREVEGEPILGDVIFWEALKFEDGREHEHVGFALSADEAVSTSDIEKQVVRHPLSPQGRKVTKVFRLPQ